MRKTLFIADLHLDDKDPRILAGFLDFLAYQQTQAVDALYILGDLFEYWLGDDCLSETAKQVANALNQFQQHSHAAVYFIHGNRDVLLAENFAKRAGMILLPETQVIDLYGQKTLILHGDSLCTDDVAYQQFRQKMRDAKLQARLLALPCWLRRLLACYMRYRSKRANRKKSAVLMNVNQQAVLRAFESHAIKQMIHGHIHKVAVVNEASGYRYVLGDWHVVGYYLVADSTGLKMETWPLPAAD